jgi:Uma2 family endonuclease
MIKSQPTRTAPHANGVTIPPLRAGDHLDADEFERRYDAMPGVKKAELIEGIVYMPSPVRLIQHGRPHGHLATWIGVYEASTPGVLMGDDSTLRLDSGNRPQADASLMIDPERGGQAGLAAGYIVGAPELLAEVSASTVSMDPNTKLEVYRRSKVREYVVWRVDDQGIDWFVLRRGRFARLAAQEGILKSEVFPGLWLDAPALLARNLARVLEVVGMGVASTGHAAFVARLGASPPRP